MFFVDTIIQAVKQVDAQIAFILAKTVLFKRFDSSLNDRQRKVLVKLFDAGPEGFDEGLSAKNYERITRISKATAIRELSELTKMGALTRVGAGRSTRYELNLDDLT